MVVNDGELVTGFAGRGDIVQKFHLEAVYQLALGQVDVLAQGVVVLGQNYFVLHQH